MAAFWRKTPTEDHRPQVVRDRPWNDAALDRALDLLPSLTPAQAADHALDYLAGTRRYPEYQVQVANAFGSRITGSLEELRYRSTAPHADGAGAADLLALLGCTLTHRAWQVRGSGSADSVSAEDFGDFHSLLELADTTLVSALTLVPTHPAAATLRLRTALGLGCPEDEFWRRFEVARRASGSLYPAHTLVLTNLCRKWYGSDEVMLDFARAIAKNAPPGDPVGAVLPLAHAEHLLSAIMFTGDDGKARTTQWRTALSQDRDALLEASQRWCGDASQPPRPHPRNVEAHQLFGWALTYQSREKARARWHLEQAGLRIAAQPWDYLNMADPVAKFLDTRRELGVR